MHAMLNTHHLPEDAGEYAEGLAKILNRIPDGWGRWISHDKGWYPLVCSTNEMLSYIDPDYEIHQVKEKYGTLRYYYGSKLPYESTQNKIMEAIVDRAEYLSSLTCEVCGKARFGEYENLDRTVKLRNSGGWVKTLCSPCATQLNYDPEVDDESTTL